MTPPAGCPHLTMPLRSACHWIGLTLQELNPPITVNETLSTMSQIELDVESFSLSLSRCPGVMLHSSSLQEFRQSKDFTFSNWLCCWWLWHCVFPLFVLCNGSDYARHFGMNNTRYRIGPGTKTSCTSGAPPPHFRRTSPALPSLFCNLFQTLLSAHKNSQ